MRAPAHLPSWTSLACRPRGIAGSRGSSVSHALKDGFGQDQVSESFCRGPDASQTRGLTCERTPLTLPLSCAVAYTPALRGGRCFAFCQWNKNRKVVITAVCVCISPTPRETECLFTRSLAGHNSARVSSALFFTAVCFFTYL